jgi:hypothetical protein
MAQEPAAIRVPTVYISSGGSMEPESGEMNSAVDPASTQPSRRHPEDHSIHPSADGLL